MTDAPATVRRHEFNIKHAGGGYTVIAATDFEVDECGVHFYDAAPGESAPWDIHTFASHPVFVERGVELP